MFSEAGGLPSSERNRVRPGWSEPAGVEIPEGFVLGAATAAYQVEGAVAEDGRGPSIWDVFCRRPGAIYGGHTGDIACDHYHRWAEDVALMARMGLKAYRFSIAWPRLFPQGRGKLNRPGLDFYSRLVDALLEEGITPWPTLYHWDLPQALEERGGWTNRDTAQAFADYAAASAEALGDRVRHWFTLNEPWCSAVLGYSAGEHAPGRREDPPTLSRVVHHLLLAHGLGVRAIRAAGAGEVGLVHLLHVPVPLTPSEEDQAAAEAAWEDLNGIWCDPLFRGRYPEGGPEPEPGDLEIISEPMDFLGLNVYFPTFVAHHPEGYRRADAQVDLPRTATGWHVYPPVVSRLLREVHRRYRPPALYLTENGCATDDRPQPDGRIHDRFRQEYLRSHLAEALRARAEGVPLRGYFVWSLMDNFEWAHGYSRRFGLFYVDYRTLERTPKDSAAWYARVLRTRRLEA